MTRRLLAVLVLTTAACNPPAVDPNADFTIEGALVDVDGTPAGNTKVHVYKVDSIFGREQDYLQNLSGLDADTIFTTVTNSAGEFSITLKGSEVNTEDGSGAAYLTAVHFADGNPLSYLASGAEWYSFSDANPTWALGDLELWDGGDASEFLGTIEFDWTSAPAPNDTQAGYPYFVFAYNAGSEDLQWAATTFDRNVDVPRAVFDDGDEAEFFITAYSKVGSQRYQLRTDLKFVNNWSESIARVNWATNATITSDLGTISGISAATDGNPITSTELYGTTTSLYIDLGQVRSFKEILFYQLGIVHFDTARVTVSASSQNTGTMPSTFTEVDSFDGDVGFQDWTYQAIVHSGSARWLEITVTELGGSTRTPYFDYVGEIKVLN